MILRCFPWCIIQIALQPELNNNLAKISHQAHQLKISFNPGPSKEAQEVIFSWKADKYSHPPLTFNNIIYQIRYKGIQVLYLTIVQILCLRKLLCLIPRFVLLTILSNYLSIFILIMVTLYMKKFIIHPFNRKQSLSNITYVYRFHSLKNIWKNILGFQLTVRNTLSFEFNVSHIG